MRVCVCDVCVCVCMFVCVCVCVCVCDVCVCVCMFVCVFELSLFSAVLPPPPVSPSQSTHTVAANTLSVCSPLSEATCE